MTATRPNILWICTDQQRYDTLGCYGNEFVRTPNIDALAGDGVVFDRAYCQNPVCTPSRSSFLTGRYPRTTRCRQNGQSIPDSEILVTRLFRDAGYRCGLAGKLHISACHADVCRGPERRIDDGYDVFNWSHHPNPDWPVNHYIDWLRARGGEFKNPRRGDCRFVGVGMPSEHHQTTWCAEMAVDFIVESSRSAGPWLFSINFFDPHHDFDPPPEYLDRYLGIIDEIPLPDYVQGELDDKSQWQRQDHVAPYAGISSWGWDKMTSRDHRMIRAAYWAMCDHIDTQVGRIIDTLRATSQLENTIVIFHSDHGEMLGDHGVYFKGPHFYDCAVRVPLIISSPSRFSSAIRSNALVELVDLPQTILDSASIPHHAGMQGKSLFPLLTGTHDLHTHRDSVYSEYYNSGNHYDPPAYGTMIRDSRHKLIVAHGTGEGELYDLLEDPNERRNLWDSDNHREIKTSLLIELTDRMAFTVDPLPAREAFW